MYFEMTEAEKRNMEEKFSYMIVLKKEADRGEGIVKTPTNLVQKQ